MQRDVGLAGFERNSDTHEELAELLRICDCLDRAISPLVEQDGSHFNDKWGYLSIAGAIQHFLDQMYQSSPSRVRIFNLRRQGSSTGKCSGPTACQT